MAMKELRERNACHDGFDIFLNIPFGRLIERVARVRLQEEGVIALEWSNAQSIRNAREIEKLKNGAQGTPSVRQTSEHTVTWTHVTSP